jgi:polar amino acid transport system permease protein
MTHIFNTLAAGIWTTVSITVCSFCFGCLGGIPLMLLRRSSVGWIRWSGIGLIEFLRSIPPIVWLFIAFYAIGTDVITLSPFEAAVLGLGAIASAYMAEIYRAALDSVPVGQWEAAGALGLRTRTLYTKVISPQALVLFIPPAATYAIGLLKDSAVASVVTVNDVTFFAYQEARQSGDGLTIFLVSALIYLLLSLPVAVLARVGGDFVQQRMTA